MWSLTSAPHEFPHLDLRTQPNDDQFRILLTQARDPARARARVDLPEPLGPAIATRRIRLALPKDGAERE
jgi:hypothetical protein